MKSLLVIALLFINFLGAQKISNKETMDKIQQSIYSNPDQAKKYIDGLLEERHKLHDTLLFDAYKSYALYYNVKGNQDQALSYHLKALTFANSDPKRKVQGMLNLSESYRKLNNTSKAGQILNEAEKISTANQNVLLGRILSVKGSNSNFLLNSKEGFEYLHRAIDLLKADKDDAMLVYAQATLAGNYMSKANYAFAINLYQDALEGYKKLNRWQNYYLTLINLSDCLLQTNKPYLVVQKLTEVMPQLEKEGNELILMYAKWKLAEAEALKNNYQQSAVYFEQAHLMAIQYKNDRATIITAKAIKVLRKLDNFNKIKHFIQRLDASELISLANVKDRLDYQEEKGYYLAKVGDQNAAITLLKSVLASKDSIAQNSENSQLLELQAQYQNELQLEKNIALEKENESLQQKNAFEKKIFWLYLSVTAIAFIALGIFVALLKSRNKLQSESIQRIDANHQLVLQEHQNQIQQKELLEKDLTLKNLALENSQLRIEQFIEDIENKNEVIRIMTDDFEKMSAANTDEKLIKECKEQLDTMVSKAIVSDEKWDSFLKLFNASYPEYLANITQKLPNLTPAEIRYITLRKLHLSPKETATALGVQTDSLRLYKHRLRKKYNLQSDEQLAEILD